jgi:hypothetical protein
MAVAYECSNIITPVAFAGDTGNKRNSQDGRLDNKGQTILGVWFLPKHLDLKK